MACTMLSVLFMLYLLGTPYVTHFKKWTQVIVSLWGAGEE